MKSSAKAWVAVAASALVSFASFSTPVVEWGVAHADLAPPAGYVETCTLEKQATPADECYSCRAYYGNRDHCSSSLQSYGFASRCRSGGASVWSEVWCRTKSANAKAVPANVLGQLADSNGKAPAADPQADSSAPTASASVPSAAAADGAPGPTSEPTVVPAITPSADPTQGAPTSVKPSSGCGACQAIGVERAEISFGALLASIVGAAGLLGRRRR